MYKRVEQQVVDMTAVIADEMRLAGICARDVVGETANRLGEECIVLELEACNRAERRRNQAFRFMSAAAVPLDVARAVTPYWANTIAHYKRRETEDESMPPASLVLVRAIFQHHEAGDSRPSVYCVYRSLVQELTQPAMDAAVVMSSGARQRWRARLGDAVRSARVG